MQSRVWAPRADKKNLPRVGLEGKGHAGNNQGAAEEVHGPLPALGLGLLAGLDAPEPAGRGFELGLVAVAAASSAGGDAEAAHGGGLGADAAHGAQGRYRAAEDGHCLSGLWSAAVCFRRRWVSGTSVSGANGWWFDALFG